MPHGPNINPSIPGNGGGPLQMCFPPEPTRWLKPFESPIRETNTAYSARKEIDPSADNLIRSSFNFIESKKLEII